MRTLFLASYFPHPGNHLMGTWALEQARALARCSDTRVVCCTPYVPRPFGVLRKARPWVDVPHHYVWPPSQNASTREISSDFGVEVTYLKGLFYPLSPFNRWAYSNPKRQLDLAWRSIRRRMIKLIDDYKPDLLYCHHSGVNGYFASRIQEHRPLPFVITDHDFGEIADCDRLAGRREFMMPVKRKAFLNVCVSKRMENDTQRIFPDVKTDTVHNGIHPLSPHYSQNPRPEELRGKQIILSVGMFARRKGFPLLVEAFKQVADKYPQAVLRIIGDGVDRPAIEAAIAHHGLQERVTLLGLRQPEEVFQEMAWADAFALIAWDEPFGVVFAEAMGAGLPVIAASDCGIADVVEHGVHGLLVPPHDATAAALAMENLISDKFRARSMGARGKAMVEKRLTWDANARQMMAIFERALEGQKRTAPLELIPVERRRAMPVTAVRPSFRPGMPVPAKR